MTVRVRLPGFGSEGRKRDADEFDADYHGPEKGTSYPVGASERLECQRSREMYG